MSFHEKVIERGIIMQVYGVTAAVHIVCYFCFIYLTFWALQSLRLDQCFKKGYDGQIKILYLLVSIAIGFGAGSFFLEVITLVKNMILPFLTN